MNKLLNVVLLTSTLFFVPQAKSQDRPFGSNHSLTTTNLRRMQSARTYAPVAITARILFSADNLDIPPPLFRQLMAAQEAYNRASNSEEVEATRRYMIALWRYSLCLRGDIDWDEDRQPDMPELPEPVGANPTPKPVTPDSPKRRSVFKNKGFENEMKFVVKENSTSRLVRPESAARSTVESRTALKINGVAMGLGRAGRIGTKAFRSQSTVTDQQELYDKQCNLDRMYREQHEKAHRQAQSGREQGTRADTKPADTKPAEPKKKEEPATKEKATKKPSA